MIREKLFISFQDKSDNEINKKQKPIEDSHIYCEYLSRAVVNTSGLIHFRAYLVGSSIEAGPSVT